MKAKDSLFNAENLRVAVDTQIANSELVILLGLLALGGLMFLSLVVLPAMEGQEQASLPSAE